MNKIAFCLICKSPNNIWLDFLNTFTKHDIFIIIDDNDLDISKLVSEFKNIKFIQINNNDCIENGYMNSNLFINKNVNGWDKAIYYFSIVNNNYDYIWYMEDANFFYNEDVLNKLNDKYEKVDLITSKIDGILENFNYKAWPNWHLALDYIHNIELPYYHNMSSAIRVSKKILNIISDYVNNNKTLFFIEVLFITLAIKNNLSIVYPEELNINYANIWDGLDNSNINKSYIYHPIKDIDKHKILRD